VNAVAALYERQIDALAPGATYAYGPDPNDECAPRVVAAGRDAAFAALADDLGEGRVEIVAQAADGGACLVEGSIAGVATIGASLRLDDDGAVERVLSFCTSPVERRLAAAGGDGRTVLDAYFDRLERADFDGAVACFSPDVLYSHPPYAPGGPRVEHHGREALLAGFVARGPRSWHHRILTCLQAGGDCLVEGDVEGAGVWLSSFSLDPHGLISRYCAFYAR
jgi:hypothetical protein